MNTPKLPPGTIARLAAANNQNEAAAALAKSLAQAGSSHVRVGIGRGGLDVLLDGRFGRVTSDTTLHDQTDEQYRRAVAVNDGGSADGLFVSEPGGGRRVAIWIDGPTPPAAQLAEAAAVVLSRPRRGWRARMNQAIAPAFPHRFRLAAVTLLIAWLALWPRPHAVEGRATIVADRSRVLAAPFEAILAEIHVRPGDRVAAGDPIVRLDGYRLRMEQQRLAAELQQAAKDRDIAMAGHRIAEAQLAGLRRDSLARQLDLTVQRLSQLVLTSPIDGIVLRGDLSRHVGSTLQLGQTVVEIAPAGSLRAEIAVDQTDRSMIAPGDRVELRFAAVGTQTTASVIQRIWPAAEIREEQNVFVAIAAMPASGPASRAGSSARGGWAAGMTGTAVIDGPTRPLAWRWLRSPVLSARQTIGW